MVYLYSSESEDESQVKLIRVPYEGSRPCRALVEVQGVPAYGVVDTGADITMSGPQDNSCSHWAEEVLKTSGQGSIHL